MTARDSAPEPAEEQPAPPAHHDSGDRVEPAGIPDDAQVDLPPHGKPDLIKVDDPAAKHRRVIDMTKLRFAIVLVAACIVFVAIASGVQYVLQEQLPDATALNNAIDWMKVIATTALGFVFGRSTLDGDKPK